MQLITKLNEVTFNESNYKESYLKAIKYASSFIKEPDILFEYQKSGLSAIKLIIYYKYSDVEFCKHRCETCKQFKSLFYIDMSPDTNCNICRQEQYRKVISQELAKISDIKKKQLMF